jgi:hypothetical protein
VILLLTGADAPPHPFPMAEVVSRIAEEFRVPSSALMVRSCQQLPRVAQFGRLEQRRAEQEIRRCARWLCEDLAEASDHVPKGPFVLSELRFAEIDEAQATPLLNRLHYLRTTRSDSTHFALVDPVSRLPVALCSLSGLQWPRLVQKFEGRFGVAPAEILDISRVFAVDTAPANSISTLLSRVRTWVRHHRRDVTLLSTVVDPNLGFTGSSYRAANWQRWMTIRARPYVYYRGRFMTTRQLREQFGTSNFGELKLRNPRAFEKSRLPLEDSLLFCCRIRGATESIPPSQVARLHR